MYSYFRLARPLILYSTPTHRHASPSLPPARDRRPHQLVLERAAVVDEAHPRARPVGQRRVRHTPSPLEARPAVLLVELLGELDRHAVGPDRAHGPARAHAGGQLGPRRERTERVDQLVVVEDGDGVVYSLQITSN